MKKKKLGLFKEKISFGTDGWRGILGVVDAKGEFKGKINSLSLFNKSAVEFMNNNFAFE